MPRLGAVVTFPQHGEELSRSVLSLDDLALADCTLAAAPVDGEVFTLTLRATARGCQVVNTADGEKWSGVLDVVVTGLTKAV